VKGGRLALAAPLAEKLTLLLADVPLKDRVAVASSPTLPDESTPAECAEILTRYRMLEMFPFKVREYFTMLGMDTATSKLPIKEVRLAGTSKGGLKARLSLGRGAGARRSSWVQGCRR
jgi:glycerate-2-kinase